ncbi:phosphomannomutase [Kineosphaera limosa]|uniref:Putative phosphoglucomutase n=1 Tax=Kineosphaera limosa NBRC 100340 TaxID=1184609 RepID=K6VI83_9MICO|nr:phospho-sugar mutase [Kineosphaera limosa]NYE01274.1 phosphomannomutase [Kineosphaera limosa]GAB95928.1 putative phosphoglucomutase [Kineosphaera limosa NBRC 100340]
MNTDVSADVVTQAREWAAHDPDEASRTQLLALVDAAAADEAAAADLASRFVGPLTFGTAGLRGAVGPGESRMNVAVVTRATAGLAAYLDGALDQPARVVVGCDARHGSDAFYDATTQVLSGAGAQVIALPRQLPTPLTAYAVRALDADAGVMVTASHNPPADNGYKVYLGRALGGEDGVGVQIVPPVDGLIAAQIAAAPPADEVARSAANVTPAPADLVDRYVARTAGLRGRTEASNTRIVLTPMHGVGGATALQVLAAAGFGDVHVVAQQQQPDPDFSTVPFPNPEEPGAIDLALALARDVDADVVIALDPDADRCSVAIPERDGTWRQLSGDEVGWLLGEQAATDPTRSGDTLACSLVSSRLLGRIAEHHGLRGATTLTGFKWIARAPGIRFGYEEAIGYCTDPESVKDKDGISAMLRVATLVDDLARDGRTIPDALDDLARTHGLFATAPLSFRVDDLSIITDAMARLRAADVTELAGSPVASVTDLAHGSPELPATDAIILTTQADDRVIVRPSGTEPKLKCYLEVVVPVPGSDIPRGVAQERLRRLGADITAVLGL